MFLVCRLRMRWQLEGLDGADLLGLEMLERGCELRSDRRRNGIEEGGLPSHWQV